MDDNGVFDRDKIARIKSLLKFNPKGLTITEISQRLKLSRISVAKYLDILLISGQVEMKMYGVAKAFFLSSRVPISAMLSFSSDFILILDSNLQIVQINDNFLKFLGVEKSILLGRSLSHPALSFLKDLPFQSVLENKAGQNEIVREVSTTQNDLQYCFRTKIIPTVFDDGSQGVTAILENITESKQSDQVKSFLAAIVESSHEAIIGKDLSGKILSWNRSAEKIYGYTPEEALGQNVEMLIPEGCKEDLPFIFDRIKKGEEILNYETKRRRKDGEIVDVIITVSPIRDDSGSIVALATITKDITDVNKLKNELHIKQSRLNEIVEFLPHPTFIVDRDKNILVWNKALEEFTGLKREDMIGKYGMRRTADASDAYRPLLIDFLDKSPDELPSHYTEVKRTKNCLSAELYLPKRDAHIQLRASNLHDEEGNFIGGIETFSDISQIKNAEESLKKAQDLLKKDTEEKIKILVGETTRLTEELEKHQGALEVRTLLEKGIDVFNPKLIIADYTGKIKYLSDSMASELMIKDKKDLLESNIFQLIDPGASQAILQLLLSRNDESTNIECSFRISDLTRALPITVFLIRQQDMVLGFSLRGQELPVSSVEEEIVLGTVSDNEGMDSTKHVFIQLMAMTPFLMLLTDFVDLIAV
jgi:PAS domain S-box-containing protein